MSKLHIKKGDTVYVNSGEDKGKTGRVLKVLVKEGRALVEGINMVSKSTKPNAKNPQGGIVKQEAAIHISNLISCSHRVEHISSYVLQITLAISVYTLKIYAVKLLIFIHYGLHQSLVINDILSENGIYI